ncbi:hypothetical protein ACFSRY_13800 [Pontibacter locisalis]|uniref:Secreted protein n=1 Tax=Pontibacter locisalis TaxID=1719035 RepID=A0ABW5IMU8_9BACT
MKKLLFSLLVGATTCLTVACGENTGDRDEEGDIPVSVDDPRAPTVAPGKPTTDIGAGLEDSLQENNQAVDSL